MKRCRNQIIQTLQEIEKENNVEVLSVEEKATGLAILDKLIRFLTAANADLVLVVNRGDNLYKVSDFQDLIIEAYREVS